jgi:hypothetical protein
MFRLIFLSRCADESGLQRRKCAAMGTAAIMVCVHNEPTFETLAVALVALLIIGMRNAWDMASFVIMKGE